MPAITVLGHDLRLGQAVLDVVARGRDLRPPIVPSIAPRAHDRLLPAGSIQHDPLFRGMHRHRKPAGQRLATHTRPDELQCLSPEPVAIMPSPTLTHTKEPHLRSSNLNFFSPTIGVRFSFGREGGRHLAAGAKEKAGRGIRSPCPAFSTGLPWPYFLCRAVSVWFPRRRNSINPTPKSVHAANATMGVDTPVLASWRIVFTMAGVTGGM